MEDTNQKTTVLSPNTQLGKVDVALSNTFGTDTMVVDVVPKNTTPAPVPPEDNTEVDHDFNVAKANIASLVQQGTSALEYAIDLAKASDSPRAFEVVATLMKNLADMNAQIVDLHTKKASMKKTTVATPDQPQKVVNNSIVFQGTTADLNKMLANMRNENGTT